MRQGSRPRSRGGKVRQSKTRMPDMDRFCRTCRARDERGGEAQGKEQEGVREPAGALGQEKEEEGDGGGGSVVNWWVDPSEREDQGGA